MFATLFEDQLVRGLFPQENAPYLQVASLTEVPQADLGILAPALDPFFDAVFSKATPEAPVDPWDVPAPAQPPQEVIEHRVDTLIPRPVTPEVVDPWDAEPVEVSSSAAAPVLPPAPPSTPAQPPRFGTRSFGSFRGGAR